MPAAAVIPAPIAYIKVVAVKKLVVELQARSDGPPSGCVLSWLGPTFWRSGMALIDRVGEPGLLL